MTRAERRRQLRESNETVYHLTAKQIADIKENAYQEAFKKAYEDKNKRINKGAKQATSHAFAYLIGITVEVMSEEFGWNQEDCNWLVEKMLEKYNSTDDIQSLITSVRELSGMILELED